MTLKMRLKIKNRSQRYDMNRPRLRHGQKHTKQKLCLSNNNGYNKQHLKLNSLRS